MGLEVAGKVGERVVGKSERNAMLQSVTLKVYRVTVIKMPEWYPFFFQKQFKLKLVFRVAHLANVYVNNNFSKNDVLLARLIQSNLYSHTLNPKK